MSFSFEPLTLELQGHTFGIDTGSEKVANAIVDLVKKIQDLEIEETEGEKPKIQLLAEAQVSFLDSVLGEGSFEKIFENRLVTYDDLEELSCYILNQITEFKNKRLSQYK